MSSVYSNHGLGERLGTRTKRYGHDWDPATAEQPVATSDEIQAMRLQTRGFPLAREQFPEADAVYDDRQFRRVGALFNSAGFFVARRRLADVLAKFDLGAGGLYEFPVYQADLQTRHEGEFFLINIGARKDTVNIEACGDARKFYVDRETGQQIWHLNKYNSEGEVVVAPSAAGGADLWAEVAVNHKLFMSAGLAEALRDAGLADDWRLSPCRMMEIA